MLQENPQMYYIIPMEACVMNFAFNISNNFHYTIPVISTINQIILRSLNLIDALFLISTSYHTDQLGQYLCLGARWLITSPCSTVSSSCMMSSCSGSILFWNPKFKLFKHFHIKPLTIIVTVRPKTTCHSHAWLITF